MSALADSWTSFFHGRVPQPNLELVRILFGAVVALYFARRLRTAGLCLGPGGLAEISWRLRSSRLRLSPYALFGHRRGLTAVPLVAGLCGALGVMLGWSTPWSAGLLFAAQLTLMAELFFMSTGVDFVVLSMSFLLSLSPAGSAWGIDAGFAPLAELPETPVWTVRLMQIQLCVVYLVSVALKYRESQWRSGWAVLFSVNALGVSRPWGAALARWPAGTRLLTWYTLALETVAPFTLWLESTHLVTLVFVLTLHAGLDLFLRLWPFQWVMIAGWLIFLRPGDFGWLP